ncbi:hypothetical protein FDUTEX481_08312 [Tolypothrix sp. PCC 7601]|nr:hypothetical protein FDUTEX481_08312 [Tolypothrix sp. PCC 7601]
MLSRRDAMNRVCTRVLSGKSLKFILPLCLCSPAPPAYQSD